jgi:hypothetical protein
MKHDDDWHAVLIRDVSPGQIWFKKAGGRETYGVCKLGGFQWAKVTGNVGAKVDIAPRMEGAGRDKQFFGLRYAFSRLPNPKYPLSCSCLCMRKSWNSR